MKPMPSLTPQQVAYFRGHLKRVCKCLEWQGYTMYGYGYISINGSLYRVHRVAYWLATGLDPWPLQVLHECDNRSCCEPAHLFPGTQLQNMQDMVRKGRKAVSNRKLTRSQVRAIRDSPASQRKLAARYNVDSATIGNVKRNKLYRDIQ